MSPTVLCNYIYRETTAASGNAETIKPYTEKHDDVYFLYFIFLSLSFGLHPQIWLQGRLNIPDRTAAVCAEFKSYLFYTWGHSLWGFVKPVTSCDLSHNKEYFEWHLEKLVYRLTKKVNVENLNNLWVAETTTKWNAPSLFFLPSCTQLNTLGYSLFVWMWCVSEECHSRFVLKV